MDSKINTNQGLRATIDYSRAPQTSGTKFGDKLSATADAALATGQLAAAFVPGGAIISAAISGVATVKNAGSGIASSSSAITAPNSTGLTAGGGSSTGGGVGTSGVAAGGSQGMLDQMQKYQEMNQSFNMQYLQLQQNMQNESRKFSVISNIMKTKHDTAKNSISNLR